MNQNRDNPQDDRRALARRMEPHLRRSIQHGMGVRGSDGADVGTVERVEGAYVKVRAGGGTHWIPEDQIMRVDGHVHLEVGADEVAGVWVDVDPNAGQPNDLHEKHERSEVKGEGRHLRNEERNERG